MESKKAGLVLYVKPTKLVADAAVSISFPVHIEGCTFHKLHAGVGCGSDCYPVGTEEAAVCYSLYSMVNMTLCGDPVAVSKSKVNSVSCGINNGNFYINWNTKGNVSAVRKSVGLALKVLNPSKVYGLYSRIIKSINGTVKKEEFSYAAAECVKGMKSNLLISVVGNIKLDDKSRLDEMLEVLVKKYNLSTVEGTKTKPNNHVACNLDDKTKLSVSGWSAVVVSDYLKYRIRGLNVLICEKFILLPLKSSVWDTLSKKISKGVKDYVKAKYSKLDDNTSAVFAYMACSNGMLGAADIKTAINNKLSASSVEAAISKVL